MPAAAATTAAATVIAAAAASRIPECNFLQSHFSGSRSRSENLRKNLVREMVIKKAFWIFGITVFLLIIFLPTYTRLQEFRDRSRNLETQIRRLKIENYLLQQELKRIENDPIYQEKIAREKMGVVRKGEVPIKIVPEKKE